MKNIRGFFFMIGFMVLGQVLFIPMLSAEQIQKSGADFRAEKKHIAIVETKDIDTVLDIPLRLGGFAVTVLGMGLFIGSSPITGLMTALPPHDAIGTAGDFLVLRPGRYTFVRPVGDFNYDLRPVDEQ